MIQNGYQDFVGKPAIGSSVDTTCLPQRRGFWVRITRKACCPAHCKTGPDAVEHPAIFCILYLTYYVLGHTKSFHGTLNSMVVWVLEHSICLSLPQ